MDDRRGESIHERHARSVRSLGRKNHAGDGQPELRLFSESRERTTPAVPIQRSWPSVKWRAPPFPVQQQPLGAAGSRIRAAPSIGGSGAERDGSRLVCCGARLCVLMPSPSSLETLSAQREGGVSTRLKLVSFLAKASQLVHVRSMARLAAAGMGLLENNALATKARHKGRRGCLSDEGIGAVKRAVLRPSCANLRRRFAAQKLLCTQRHLWEKPSPSLVKGKRLAVGHCASWVSWKICSKEIFGKRS